MARHHGGFLFRYLSHITRTSDLEPGGEEEDTGRRPEGQDGSLPTYVQSLSRTEIKREQGFRYSSTVVESKTGSPCSDLAPFVSPPHAAITVRSGF